MIKKFLLSLLLAATASTAVQAIPAYPRRQKVTLPNGKVVEATLRGDEFFHFLMTDDGTPLRAIEKNKFEIIPQSEFSQLAQKATEENQTVNAARRQKMQKRVGTIMSGLSGTKRGLVILVNFKDLQFSLPNPHDLYNRMFNEEGFSDYGFQGSLRDYFYEQSYGQFTIDFDVVGPYTLPKNMNYYGQNSGSSHDANAREMAWDAMKLADKDVNYNAYDWDHDGEVEQIYIIYAGYGENYSGNNPSEVWAHSSSVASVSGGQKLDNQKLSTYACSCEIQGWEDAGLDIIPEGIGAPCHEFSHCLGYPDFYNTSYSGGYEMQEWDILSQGSYNGMMVNGRQINGILPASYTSYERMAAGWLTPIELTSETQVKDMKPLNDKSAKEAYIMRNPNHTDEYFLLENRQPIGFDRGLPGHGLLMLHVDFTQGSWNGNKVNADPDRQGMTIIAADNRYDAYSKAGDTFPGSGKVTRIDDHSNHGEILIHANTDGTYFLHQAIENITENKDGLISFLACRPHLVAPVLEANRISDTSFQITWPKVEGATEYEIEVTEQEAKSSPEESCYLIETFKNCYKSSNGFTDIGTSLSNYTDSKLFSGTALYQSPNYLKIGSSSKTGSVKSPVFATPSTGEITIVLGVKPGTAGKEVKLPIAFTTENGTFNQEELFSEEGYLIVHTSQRIDGRFYFTLNPDGMMYLNYVAVYNGNFSAQELGLTALNAPAKAPAHHTKKYNKTTTENSYTFTDMAATSKFDIQVRAKDSQRISFWSEIYTLQAANDTPVIAPVADEEDNAAYYDLSGRRVTRPTKGLYIHNGKKVMVKPF